MTKKLKQITGNSFIVSEVHAITVEQLIDFAPIQEYYSLSGDYCLVHWLQPSLGEGTWGVYCSRDKTYRLLNEVPLYKPVQVDFLSMPPNTSRTAPTYVIKLGCTVYDSEFNVFDSSTRQ